MCVCVLWQRFLLSFFALVLSGSSKLFNAEIKQRKIAFIDEMVALSLADEWRLSKLLEAFARAENKLILSSIQIKKIQQQISESVDVTSYHSKEHHMMQMDRLMRNFKGNDRDSSLSEWVSTIAIARIRIRRGSRCSCASFPPFKKCLLTLFSVAFILKLVVTDFTILFEVIQFTIRMNYYSVGGCSTRHTSKTVFLLTWTFKKIIHSKWIDDIL